MRLESWLKERERDDSEQKVYIWHSQQEKGSNRVTINIRDGCNDTEGQHVFQVTSEKIALVYYKDLKLKRGREKYIEFCSRNYRNGLI